MNPCEPPWPCQLELLGRTGLAALELRLHPVGPGVCRRRRAAVQRGHERRRQHRRRKRHDHEDGERRVVQHLHSSITSMFVLD